MTTNFPHILQFNVVSTPHTNTNPSPFPITHRTLYIVAIFCGIKTKISHYLWLSNLTQF